MPIKEVAPIKINKGDFDHLESVILDIFKKEIYLPLLGDVGVKKNVLQNSEDDLIKAIQRGRIAFHHGEFSGSFDANTSKEIKKMGGKWDNRKSVFKLNMSELSPDIRIAIASSEMKFTKAMAKIDERLRALNPKAIGANFKMASFFDKTLFNLDKDIQKTLQNITVIPKLTDSQRARIAEGYTNDLQRYIVDFTEEEISKLRKSIQKRVMSGQRYEGAVNAIKQSYGVSQNKAKFLARQETNLMMQEFKKVRYVDAGSKGYNWGCAAGSPNHPVRPDHKRLEGTFHLWTEPPVTNLKTGARNHPGCDYGCRCFPKVVIKF